MVVDEKGSKSETYVIWLRDTKKGLRELIDRTLLGIHEDGTFQEICRRHFEESEPYCNSNVSPEPLTVVPTKLPTVTPMEPVDLTPIRIGYAIDDLSPTASRIGIPQKLAAEVAETFFNKQGGIGGRQIKLVFQPTGGDEAGAKKAFQTLISDTVVAIIGPSISQQAFAAHPLAQDAGIVAIGPSNTAKGIPQQGDYIFRVSSGVDKYVPYSIAEAFRRQPSIEKVVIAYAENDAYSRSEAEAFQFVLTDTYDVKVDSITFQTTDKVFESLITKVIVFDPDLIVISGLPENAALVKQLRDSTIDTLIIGGNGLNTSEIFPICDEQCIGLIVAQSYDPTSQDSINKTFLDTYADEMGAIPGQFSAQMFTAIQVVVEALREIDEKELNDTTLSKLRAGLKEKLLSGIEFQTPLGEISFDNDGDIVQTDFSVAEIKRVGDELQFVKIR